MTNRNTLWLFSPGRLLPALALPILMLAAFLAGCGTTPDAGVTEGSSEERTAAAEFSLTDLQGRVHRLSDYRGKVVVLNFWDTWCGPCRQEIPGFIAIQQKLEADGLQLLGVALGKEGIERVRTYSSEAGINYPVLLLGPDTTMLDNYGGINSIPATFIIDRDGFLAGEHIGYLSKSAFESMVTPILRTGKERP